MIMNDKAYSKLYKKFGIKHLAIHDSMLVKRAKIFDEFVVTETKDMTYSYIAEKSNDITMSDDIALVTITVNAKYMIAMSIIITFIDDIYDKAFKTTGLHVHLQGFDTDSQYVKYDYFDNATSTYHMYSIAAVNAIDSGHFGGKPV